MCENAYALEGGGRVVVYRPWSESLDPAVVYDAATGAPRLEVDRRFEVAVPPEGSSFAVLHAGGGELRAISTGEPIRSFGAAMPALPPLDPDDEDSYAEPTTAQVAFAPGGSHLAWVAAEGSSVEVVAIASGAATRVDIGSRVGRIALAPGGSGLAVIRPDPEEGEVLELHASSGGWRRTAAHRFTAQHGMEAFCIDGRLHGLRSTQNGFSLVAGGACGRATGELTGGGRFLVFRSGGMVRVRRLADDRALTFRTMLRGEDAQHVVHDDGGAWWSSGPAGEVPDWVRVAGPDGAMLPLDPALRRDDLLARFFAGG
jgi:hypothetical protein